MTWKEWIEEELRARHMTKTELARRAGITKQAVWEFVNKKKPDFRYFLYLVVCLGIETSYDGYKELYSKIGE